MAHWARARTGDTPQALEPLHNFAFHPCTLILLYLSALSPECPFTHVPSHPCLFHLNTLSPIHPHALSPMCPWTLSPVCPPALSPEVTDESPTMFLDSHKVQVFPSWHQGRWRLGFWVPTTKRKVQTSLITCCVEVSPPPPHRTTTPSVQMAFVGPYYGSKILGQKTETNH